MGRASYSSNMASSNAPRAAMPPNYQMRVDPGIDHAKVIRKPGPSIHVLRGRIWPRLASLMTLSVADHEPMRTEPRG